MPSPAPALPTTTEAVGEPRINCLPQWAVTPVMLQVGVPMVR
ncbi:MAG: hypothetical protein ABSG62_24405 [Terracidiphilus sp.]